MWKQCSVSLRSPYSSTLSQVSRTIPFLDRDYHAHGLPYTFLQMSTTALSTLSLHGPFPTINHTLVTPSLFFPLFPLGIVSAPLPITYDMR